MSETAAPSRSLKAILGPTNTGKTHFALERMLAHRTGMIGLPLRLLAREVYGTIAGRIGAGAVALVTGEERIVPPNPRYWVATVEAMPLDLPVECLAVDEIQTATDFDRGHVFTDRLLRARGTRETLLLGAATMTPVVRALLPQADIIHRPRLSQLTWAGSRKISRQPQRSAIVAFSAAEVYAIAELLRRERGGAAVVMGALSPRTRNAQVALYQSGEVDFLVATDAIGMGLNLDVHHVAFAADTKFDGRQTRPLTPAEFGQIAGRAGRHARDGTFGVTAGVEPFDEELVVALETHDFAPVRQVQWRNPDVDFSSPEALRRSLEATPGHGALTRVPVATDQAVLEMLVRGGAGALASDEDGVRLLWACCRIPDYRDISPAQHGEIVSRVFTDLRRAGRVDADWIAEQVRFCDNTSGDIDTLSNRIRQVRTWTFIANRRNWLEDPAHWRETARDIEDRLSDALHERLIQRFVDRRTSVLIRHLRDKRMTAPEINDKGEVLVEGHLIGSIEGFRFALARGEGEADAKGLRAAAASVVAPAIRERALRLAAAPNEQFVLATDGKVRWRGEVVAELAEGGSLFAPRVIVLADDSLSGPELERVQDRLDLWVRLTVNTQLEQIVGLIEPVDLDGPARGIAYQLAESLGILPRPQVADAVKGLDQEVRGRMRKLGVKFGAYHLYVPQSLKPAPRELALILFALKNGGIRQKGVSELPHVVLAGRTSFEVDPEIPVRLYEIAGFKVAGKRAVRVDILERLADIIRPLVAFDPARAEGAIPAGAGPRNGFRVTVEMTSLLGCAGEDFASILKSLGYRVERTPLPPESTAEPDLPAALDGEAPEGAEAAQASEVADETAALMALDGAVPPEAPRETPQETPDEALPETEAAAGGAPEPQEPRFDEVWYPGGRRPGGRERQRHNRGRQSQANGAEGEAAAEGRPRGKRRGPPREGHPGNGQRPPGKGARRPGKEDARPQGQGQGQRPPRREPRERPVDPDSPFAALAVLKERKPE